MKEQHSHLEIAIASIKCFQDDGRLDPAELDQLVSIAERDGSIDPEEARVLERIMGKLRPEELDEAMLTRVEALRAKLLPLL
ncbi:hypothetical protein [Dyella sp.]|jgi:tellurite resistance protein|uniref:hypothetical protein n=1 Tax=Dyella sp. TaxID=1869338 RepID=UPI002D78F10A|nr:hypothetical protein [Dyella sp.]HET6433474.1 hypothetical protein [Dyella sp.]